MSFVGGQRWVVMRRSLVVVLAALLGSLAMAPVGAASAADLGPSGSLSAQIVGGSNATIADAKWQVALLHTNRSTDYDAQFCGGSFISLDWIVTAAHCTEGETVSTIKVLYGTATLSATTYNGRAIDRIVAHPSYNSRTTDNDIALIHLAQAAPAASVTPLLLPSAKPASGTSALITGWGSTVRSSPNGSTIPSYPTTLQKATLSVIADTNCRTSLGVGFVSTTMLCAGTPGTPNYKVDTCQGDSGGPLAVKVGTVWYLDGITSWGFGCAWTQPGVYTNVANFVSWINANALSDFTSAPSPTIMGASTAKVGTTLSVNLGVWSPSPTSYTYSWKSNGTVVGTAATYVPTSADVGRTITVTVTGSKQWYRSATRTSVATRAVAR